MTTDARGVRVRTNALVVWFGRLPGESNQQHLGEVVGFSLFGGRVIIDEIFFGSEGEWRSPAPSVRIKSSRVLVINDMPESPRE